MTVSGYRIPRNSLASCNILYIVNLVLQ